MTITLFTDTQKIYFILRNIIDYNDETYTVNKPYKFEEVINYGKRADQYKNIQDIYSTDLIVHNNGYRSDHIRIYAKKQPDNRISISLDIHNYNCNLIHFDNIESEEYLNIINILKQNSITN